MDVSSTYRQTFVGWDVIVDLGIIDDADETFMNGTRVGGMGRVPDGSAWQSDRLYRVPGHLLNRYFNYLAVHVWSLWGLGGIVGPPVMTVALASADANSYHHTAIISDNIFDPCLQVDYDSNPSLPPHSGVLPVNMPFITYKTKLVDVSDVNNVSGSYEDPWGLEINQ